MPKKHKKFIKEWKKILPDYKFKCWNESNFDVDSVTFTRDAKIAGKWAFIADYVRVYALYNEGGVYMDTDVRLKSSFDPYLNCSFFSSFECHLKGKSNLVDINGNKINDNIFKIPQLGIMSAIIAAEQKNILMYDCLKFYNKISFDYVFRNNYTIPTVLAHHAENYGFRYIDKYQVLDHNMHIYPTSIFSNYDAIYPSSVAIHYVEGSWRNKTFLNSIRNSLYRIALLRHLKYKIEKIYKDE